MNDTERGQWAMNDESLYRQWKSKRGMNHRYDGNGGSGAMEDMTMIVQTKAVQQCKECGHWSRVRIDPATGQWPKFWACHDCDSLIQPVVYCEYEMRKGDPS